MTNTEIILYILWVILALIVGTNGIFNLIKFFKKSKIDESEYRVRARIIAELLETGIEVPKDIIIATLKGSWSKDTWATRVAELSKHKTIRRG